MKTFTLKNKTFLLLLALTGVNIAHSQNIEPLLSEGNRWNVIFRDVWSPPEPQRFTTYCYKLEGDTLLDGVSYKLLYSTLYEDLSHFSYRAALREDPEGRVYCRHSSSSDETLLYDFSLQPNDSISIDGYEYLVLEDIRDTIIGDVSRKKFTFFYSDHIYEKEIWIEGIGSEYGLLNPGVLALSGEMTYLLCSYENEELVWQNTDFNTCFYTNWNYDLVGEEYIDNIKVFPNPASDKVIIIGAPVEETYVYNIFGQLVAVCKNNEINFENLTNGLYILHIKTNDSKSIKKSVIKN